MEQERDNKRRMVFSSNWSQPNNQLQENGNIVNNGRVLLSNQFQPLPSNPNPNHHHHVTATVGLPARLGGSMAERARQANAPPPPGALPCPRCDSTNTKFCYYNNYNLNQPRYSCKACRRYWTRGGTLRNVPIGGGSRKNNKKSKNGNSKTPTSKHSSSTVNVTSQHGHDSSSGQLTTNQQFQFSTPTLHSLTQLGGIGLNLTATNGHNQTHDQIGSTLMNNLGFHNNNDNNLMSHFPLFDPYGYEGNIGISFSSTSMIDSRVYLAADPVKMEEQTNLVNVTKPVSGLMSTVNQTNQYYWNNNSDFSGPSSNDNHHHDQLM